MSICHSYVLSYWDYYVVRRVWYGHSIPSQMIQHRSMSQFCQRALHVYTSRTKFEFCTILIHRNFKTACFHHKMRGDSRFILTETGIIFTTVKLRRVNSPLKIAKLFQWLLLTGRNTSRLRNAWRTGLETYCDPPKTKALKTLLWSHYVKLWYRQDRKIQIYHNYRWKGFTRRTIRT